MGEKTGIEWTDHTWNPWLGCTEVSPACDFCYARTMMQDRYKRVTWGAGEDRKRTSPANWREPLRWQAKAAARGSIETVFTLSLGDIWDNEVDPIWRRDAFAVMEATPNLIYLLLSKRIGNAERMCDVMRGERCLPPNAALGSTMINQPEWDRDFLKLKWAKERLGARVSFVSIEPMQGPINMRDDRPDWVIVGGESGPNARPMHPDWARSIRDQCAAAGIPLFFKQWGEWEPHRVQPGGDLGGDVRADRVRCVHPSGRDCVQILVDTHGARQTEKGSRYMRRVGKKAAGAMLDGREWRQFPAPRQPTDG
jgi:protein gp37